jgi:hypothetical protein
LAETLTTPRRRAPPKPSRTAPLNRRLVQLLELAPEDLVVGLGAGSSRHCLAMLDMVLLRYQIVLVDPSPKRLWRVAATPGVRVVTMSPLDFARFPMQWDKVLLDDAFAEEDLDWAAELLCLVFARLRPNGRMIAVLPSSALPLSAALRRSMEFGCRARESGFEVAFETLGDDPDRFNLVVGRKHAPS